MKLPNPSRHRRARRTPEAIQGDNSSRLRASSSAVSRRGVALVITLIMLSVITFMAITFLVLSRREKGSVTTTTDQIMSRQFADSAFERAKVEILAPIITFSDDQRTGLLVATNLINRAGYDPDAFDHRTNVNYEYTIASGNPPLDAAEGLRNLTNLFYNPRPPVFISNEFRYYLDLNRNGRFDTNGLLPVFSDDPALPYVSTNGTLTDQLNEAAHQFFVGDPEWIGVLERPELPHSSSNRFVGRYTYLVVPLDRTLDVNRIHNQTVTRSVASPLNDGYRRNQGVGPWEINLAAFLADLNTNLWAPAVNRYRYQRAALTEPITPGAQGTPNQGIAFEDAFAFLRHRYGSNYNSLMPADQQFPNFASALTGDNIDQYSDGDLMVATNITETLYPDAVSTAWAGSENYNRYFTVQDFFEPLKTSPGFVNRLLSVSASTNSYDRYTYYRMIDQLGTDSTPERNKINLNYMNVDTNGGVVPFMETNLIAWTPLQFFSTVGDKMLRRLQIRDHLDRQICITNIPIYPTNYYTPAVHRTLQLAANLYDATTNRFAQPGQTNRFFPTVFKPFFRVDAGPDGTNVVAISGYQEINGTNALDRPFLEPRNMATVIQAQNLNNVHGVPWIIGAKKGFPNFNEFAMNTKVTVTRKLEFRRAPGNPNNEPIIQTNQMYKIAVTNSFGVELWNSYSNVYPRPLRILTAIEMFMVLTNDEGGASSILVSNRLFRANSMDVDADTWDGFISPNYDEGRGGISFRIPMIDGTNFLADSIWRPNGSPELVPSPGPFEQGTLFPVPRWWLKFNTRVRVAIVDTSINPPRLVDFVNLDDAFHREGNTNDVLDLTYALMADAEDIGNPMNEGDSYAWVTNRQGRSTSIAAPTYGIANQILISLGILTPNWESFNLNPSAGVDKDSAIRGFRVNLGLTSPSGPYQKSNLFYAPFDPTRSFYFKAAWQANDPLVHYTLPDLGSTNRIELQTDNPVLKNLRLINDRYEPWGGNPRSSGSAQIRYELAVKDPLVRRSDDWDFLGTKLPNIGWLGRVHRGTPWQTIYLKGKEIRHLDSNNTNVWNYWPGQNLYAWLRTNGNLIAPRIVAPHVAIQDPYHRDADYTRPERDRELLDLFTVSIHDNATYGRLSINQTNLAAWSGVLSGVIVQTNNASNNDLLFTLLQVPPLPPPVGWTTIEPAGLYPPDDPDERPPLVRIVDAINDARDDADGNTFEHLGDFLAARELTDRSPFLNRSSAVQLENGITDQMYERIPQQILSLLTVNHTPRFAIYSYGQTLRPAPSSVIVGGAFSQLCTNYQITAEAATRAIVRMEGTWVDDYTNHVTDPRPDRYGRFYPPRIVVEQFNVLPPE